MALSVQTVRGAGSLSERAQADAETEVGDVLSHYVVEGFLGDYPRENFVDAFDAFTGGAARSAAGDIDLLTGATAIATPRRSGRRGSTPASPSSSTARTSVGASAAVRLGFEAELPDGDTGPFTLTGTPPARGGRKAPGRSSGTTSRATTRRRSKRRCRHDGPATLAVRWPGWRSLLGLAGLTVPDAEVHPATISLTKIESAKDVDFSDGVVWILALGSDARPGQDVQDGNTDAIQLVGLDLASGRAAGIGIPRDSWLRDPGVGPGPDQRRHVARR